MSLKTVLISSRPFSKEMASPSLEGSWEVVVGDVALVLTVSSLGVLGRKRSSVVITIFRDYCLDCPYPQLVAYYRYSRLLALEKSCLKSFDSFFSFWERTFYS